MAASLSFQAAATQGGASGSYSLAFTVASAAGQERLVGLCSITNASFATTTFTSVLIDGQSATQVGSYVRVNDGSGNGPIVALFRANGTSGTSINVTCTIGGGGAVFDCRGAVWTLSGAGTLYASATDTAQGVSNIGNLDLNVNTIIDGATAAFVLAYASSTKSTTWSGLTETHDGGANALYGTDWITTANLNTGSTSTPLTVTATLPTDFNSNSAVVGIAVSFNPASSNVTLTAAAGSYALTGSTAGDKYVMPLGAAGA